jgi:DNA-binding NarL/FixJ family response regulator
MRVALFWDGLLMAEAIAALLEQKGHFEVVGYSNSARECLVQVRDRRADAIIAKSSLMQDGSGDLLHGARLVNGFGLIVLSDGDVVVNAEGEEGTLILGRNASAEDLFGTIRQIAPHTIVPRRLRVRQSSQLGLSAREHEIAELVAKGLSNKRISEIIGLREQSVKNMVSTIIRRLSCENRTQVALKLASMAERARMEAVH